MIKAFLLTLVILFSGCVMYPEMSHRTSVITNQETGETSVVDTTEETSIPAPWTFVGTPADWTFGTYGWYYLGVPYFYYGAPYYTWGIGGLYAPTYIYRSNYWYLTSRWNGYHGQGAKWHGYNNRWYGGRNYHGQKYGTRTPHQRTYRNIPNNRGVHGNKTFNRPQSTPSVNRGNRTHTSTIRTAPVRRVAPTRRSTPTRKHK